MGTDPAKELSAEQIHAACQEVLRGIAEYHRGLMDYHRTVDLGKGSADALWLRHAVVYAALGRVRWHVKILGSSIAELPIPAEEQRAIQWLDQACGYLGDLDELLPFGAVPELRDCETHDDDTRDSLYRALEAIAMLQDSVAHIHHKEPPLAPKQQAALQARKRREEMQRLEEDARVLLQAARGAGEPMGLDDLVHRLCKAGHRCARSTVQGLDAWKRYGNRRRGRPRKNPEFHSNADLSRYEDTRGIQSLDGGGDDHAHIPMAKNKRRGKVR